MREEQIIKAEQLLNELISELSKIKSASEQLANAKSVVSKVTESAEKIAHDTSEVLEAASNVIKRIEEAKVKEQYELIQKKIEDFSTYAKTLSESFEKTEEGLSSISNLIKELDANLQQHLESLFEKTFTKIDSLQDDLAAHAEHHTKRFDKLKKALFISLGVIIAIQVLTLVLIFNL